MQKQNNSTTKYPLATAGKRFLARIIDILIISCLVLGIGFAVFCTDPNFSWKDELVLQQKWRYAFFVILMLFVFVLWMIVAPLLFKQTFGMKITKIKYFKKDENKNYLLCLCKHEIFIWEIIALISLVMGITLSCLSNKQIDSLLKGAEAIFASKVPDGIDKVFYYIGTGFSCFYSVSIVLLIFVIVFTFIKNGTPAFHDKFSGLYMISTVSLVEKYQKPNQPKQDDIIGPGAISPEALEEINSL